MLHEHYFNDPFDFESDTEVGYANGIKVHINLVTLFQWQDIVP